MAHAGFSTPARRVSRRWRVSGHFGPPSFQSRQEILTAEEERGLIRAAQCGDEVARNRLVASNMGYIIDRVKECMSRIRIPYEDAIQEGVLGYMDGIVHFDPALGYRLNAYAIWRIRCRLQLADQDYMRIRVPLRHDADGAPICKRDETRASAAAARRCSAASEMIGEGTGHGRARAHEQVFGAGADGRSDEGSGLDAAAEAARIRGWLGQLRTRDRLVVVLRFGLEGEPPMSLEAVGKVLGGLTRERIRQIEERAMGELRESAGLKPRGEKAHG